MHSLNKYSYSPLLWSHSAGHHRDGEDEEACSAEEGSGPSGWALLGFESQLCRSLTGGPGPISGHL